MTSRERFGGVGLRDVFRKDGKLFKVVCIATDPTVTLEEANGGDGLPQEQFHLVIGSPLFHEYEQLIPKGEE